jgi:tRNA(fMet)-specific endonuclease VapC
MAGDLALDTNIVIALFDNDPAVTQRVAATPSVYLPVTVLGELCFGAHKSKQTAANLKRIDDLAARMNVLACDLDTARIYGQMKQRLRVQGTPIPDNDVWIAAQAWQHNIPLLTRDLHFSKVSGLTVETC